MADEERMRIAYFALHGQLLQEVATALAPSCPREAQALLVEAGNTLRIMVPVGEDRCRRMPRWTDGWMYRLRDALDMVRNV